MLESVTQDGVIYNFSIPLHSRNIQGRGFQYVNRFLPTDRILKFADHSSYVILRVTRYAVDSGTSKLSELLASFKRYTLCSSGSLISLSG